MHIGQKQVLSFENCLKSLEGASLIDEDLQKKVLLLCDGVKRDQLMLQLLQNQAATRRDWLDSCADMSEMKKPYFVQELNALRKVMDQMQNGVDLVLCSEKILDPAGSCYQTATNGVFLHRFFARFSKETVIFSSDTFQSLVGMICFPESFCGGFFCQDKFQINGSQSPKAYNNPTFDSIDRLKCGIGEEHRPIIIKKGMKVAVFGFKKDAAVAEWIKQEACGIYVSFFQLGSRLESNQMSKIIDCSVKFTDIEVLHAVAIDYIFDCVHVSSYDPVELISH